MIGADGHLSGYIQCVSQVFHVKEHSVKLLKVTATRDCFCHDSLNILVRWLESRESDDDRLARKKFLHVCSVGRFIMAKGLRESKARECVMWIYQPGFSEAETHPALLPCDPVKCPSWPVCLVSRLSCRVHFVHKHGAFFTCTAVDDSLSPLSTLLGICTSFPNRHKLNPGRRIVFHNLWLCPMPSTAFAPYNGVVILGIFTACSQPPFSLIKNNQAPIPEEPFLSDLMLPNKLIDVESLVNRLLDILCSTHTYQQPAKFG
ncbi:unnamed protein product [Dicrocoelium dendriticum]|nr:unnamed protein product [Dicrocoelium dendriticum]